MRALGVGVPFMGGIGAALGNVFDAYYKDGHPYKNYNLDKQGEGMFWARVVNPNRKDDPEAMACDRPPFWGDKGESPDEPLAVSPAVLAAYAYDELPVPDTEVAMAPPGGTKVNLPTWIWLDKAKFKKVSVTASIPGAGLSATTTARPVSLTIDPGTADAETFPASGECPIRGGRIGAPRAKGTCGGDAASVWRAVLAGPGAGRLVRTERHSDLADQLDQYGGRWRRSAGRGVWGGAGRRGAGDPVRQPVSVSVYVFASGGEARAMADRLVVDGDELEHFMKLLNRSRDSLKSMRKARVRLGCGCRIRRCGRP